MKSRPEKRTFHDGGNNHKETEAAAARIQQLVESKAARDFLKIQGLADSSLSFFCMFLAATASEMEFVRFETDRSMF